MITNTKVLTIVLCMTLVFSFSACKKEEPQLPMQQAPGPLTQGPIQSQPMPPGQMPPGQMMPRGKSQVVVPDFVKGKWSAAEIIFEDKMTKVKKEYKVKLNSDFNIPNSNLRIYVGEFLPHFTMDGLNLTSASNNPTNPALSVRVFENNKLIFPAPGKDWGWLFSKVPSIHPFEHSRYSIILKKGIKKG